GADRCRIDALLRAPRGRVPYRRSSGAWRATDDGIASLRPIPRQSGAGGTRSTTCARTSCRLQHAAHRSPHPLVPRDFALQVPASRFGQPVIASTVVLFGSTPFGRHRSVDQETLQSGIKGALLYVENIFGQRSNLVGDLEAVHLFGAGKRPEDQ